jgi:nucleoredoxin
MPWLRLDYNQQDKKEELSDKFDVKGIPKLILLDGDSGDIITTEARDQIQNKDKKGEHFPWKSEENKEE